MPIHGVHHIALSVPDLDRARAFYVDLLGFEVVGGDRWAGSAMSDRMMGVSGGAGAVLLLKAGNLFLEFFRFDSPAPAGQDAPPAVNRYGYTHIALDVTDIETLHRRLTEAGMAFNCTPQSGYGVRATYGRDPFGNLIELQQIDDDTHMPRL